MSGPSHGLRWPRHLAGRGRYLADLKVPGAREAAFLRSPHAHAAILGIDVSAARAAPRIDAVFTHDDLSAVLRPWRATHGLFPDMVAPEQTALAAKRVRHVGEPVAIVVGANRAACEDALELIEVEYEALAPVAGVADALSGPAIHAEAPGNLCLEASRSTPGCAEAFAEADVVVEGAFRFGRHTGIPLEPRGLIADYEPGEGTLTVHHSHQCPSAMQEAFATLLGIEAHLVRVICPDVGGGFGIKQQVHADEMAVAAAARLIGRPVRFVADRLESMASDIQARHHEVTARLALDRSGRMIAIEVDDIHAIGPYPQYPRSSAGEGRAVLSLSGAPYALREASARSRAVFTNLGMSGHYRGVGHPIAAAVTEGLVDLAARRLGTDPWAIRRRNFATYGDGAPPSALGVCFEDLPFGACLDVLEARHPRASLDAWRAEARGRGQLAGYGIAVFIEMTSRGPGFYGDGDVRVSTRDYCTLRLEPNGAVSCLSSVTEQGQGVETGVAQIVAETIGMPRDHVRMVTGDTATTGHGGGTWGSRSLAIGGHAAWEAARALREEILEIAAGLLQRPRWDLSLRDGEISARDARTGMSLAELAALAHYRPHHLPYGGQPKLIASASFGPLDAPFRAGCGVQLSCVEIDPETGMLRLARHAVAHYCGAVVNPLLVDGQIKGGVVQGLGAALTEELDYDAEGQLLNATLAEYRVPMPVETPEIEVHHVHHPEEAAQDGRPPRHVGVGEAGTAGASAAVLNAVNDALSPRGAALWQIPATPVRVLAALDAAQGSAGVKSRTAR